MTDPNASWSGPPRSRGVVGAQREEVGEVGALAAGTDPAGGAGLGPGDGAGREVDPGVGRHLDHRTRCAPGVPRARDALDRSVRRHPDLDGMPRCAGREPGQVMLGEQTQIRSVSGPGAIALDGGRHGLVCGIHDGYRTSVPPDPFAGGDPMTARLSPRRHALLALLAGIVAGAAVVTLVVLVRGGGSDDPVAGTSPSPSVASAQSVRPPDPAGGPLDPAVLRFEAKKFGTKTADVGLEVPTGWKYIRQDDYNAWFVGPSGAWRLRVDATANPRSIDQMLVVRERSLKASTKDLNVVDRTKGSQTVTWSPGTLSYRTLVYSYTSSDRGHRLVINRFIALGDGGRTAIELTTSGRPEDETGLTTVLEQATRTLVLSG